MPIPTGLICAKCGNVFGAIYKPAQKNSMG